MKRETANNGRPSGWGRRRIWTFFAVLLIALIWSGVAGTQSVRAFSTCTPGQCSAAHAYAVSVCHGNPDIWECPFNSGGEPDDYFFFCNVSGDAQVNDCGTNAPS